MIGWLQGTNIDIWLSGSRKGIVLVCSGIGYEVQLLPRELAEVESETQVSLWIHQIQRDEGILLFGFKSQKARNLFRSLISVSGVGPQIGIALLEGFGPEELISAIIDGKSSKLSQANGVGKRTAERLSIELRKKLSESIEPDLPKEKGNDEKDFPSYLEKKNLLELGSTLESLGYEDSEIKEAIKAIKEIYQENPGGKPAITEDFDAWLRDSLKWLSQ